MLPEPEPVDPPAEQTPADGGLRGWFDGAELRVDLNKLPALAEDRMALWREVSAADWLSADEKKALLGVA